MKDYNEYSLHQEFSAAKTKEVERNVKTLYQYLEDKDLLKDGNQINMVRLLMMKQKDFISIASKEEKNDMLNFERTGLYRKVPF